MIRTRNLLLGGNAHPMSTDAGLLILRVYTGVALAVLHGWGKVPPRPGFVAMVGRLGLPAPEIFAWMAAFAEFGGGLLLAVGLLTRPAAFLIVGHFTFVVLLAHAGDSFADRELPLFFWVVALLFLLAGPGRYSADAALRRGRP